MDDETPRGKRDDGWLTEYTVVAITASPTTPSLTSQILRRLRIRAIQPRPSIPYPFERTLLWGHLAECQPDLHVLRLYDVGLSMTTMRPSAEI